MDGGEGKGGPDEGLVTLLQRWERFGGVWAVVARQRGAVTLSLRRCDGGEEQQRVTTADPAVMRWLRGRTESSEG